MKLSPEERAVFLLKDVLMQRPRLTADWMFLLTGVLMRKLRLRGDWMFYYHYRNYP